MSRLQYRIKPRLISYRLITPRYFSAIEQSVGRGCLLDHIFWAVHMYDVSSRLFRFVTREREDRALGLLLGSGLGTAALQTVSTACQRMAEYDVAGIYLLEP